MYVPLPDYGQADYQIMLGGRMYVVPVDDVEELISALQLAKTDADEQRSHENPYFREVE